MRPARATHHPLEPQLVDHIVAVTSLALITALEFKLKLMPPPNSTPRRCPLCGGGGTTLMAPEASEFSRTNPTYAEDFRAPLGLPDTARFPIDRCDACGFVYAAQLPSRQFFDALYDVVIDRDRCIEGSENWPGYARRLRYVAELLELAPEGEQRSLDYGSGMGVTLRILTAIGVPAIGFDPSALRRDYSSAMQVTADHDDLQSAAPFTIVVLDNVVEHLPDPVATIERIATLTSPGAVAYVSVPPYEPVFLQQQIDAHQHGTPLDMTLNPWEHLNYFSAATLDQLMARGGFQRVGRPDIGLRREAVRLARVKNTLASMLRLAQWGAAGLGLVSAENSFYRRP